MSPDGAGGRSAGGAGVDAVLVVVPARDEADRLPACLHALERAVAAATAPDAGVVLAVDVVVVLDRCRDASAQVVAEHAGARSLRSMIGSAGGARRLGVADGLARLAARGVDPGRTWIASTDADSRVPADWLAVHLAQAAAGADLLLGTVRPMPGELPEPLRSAWSAQYRPVDGHGHVHGANLGVRASAYLAAGGFPAVATHEDAALARSVRAVGGRVVATALAPVTTSARLRGRAPLGFAAHLAALAGSAGRAGGPSARTGTGDLPPVAGA